MALPRVLEVAARSSGGNSQEMTHAWLLVGDNRHSVAQEFALSLASDSDVEVMSTSGLSVKVDEVRDLVTRASWAPSVSDYRVVVIESAEKLTDSAGNALLKAIEEPESRCVWILCAPSVDDVLQTIKSRCRLVVLAGSEYRITTPLLVLDYALAVKDFASAFDMAGRFVDAAKTNAESASGEIDEREDSALREAWGVQGSRVVAGGAKVLKELEREQKSRNTSMVREYLEKALLDLASIYQDRFETSQDVKWLRAVDAILKSRMRLAHNSAPLLTIEALFVEILQG